LRYSIKSKFLFFSLTIFLVMFGAVGAHNYYGAKLEIHTRMNEQVEMVKLRAATVLPSLIWNFSNDSIIDFSKAELRSEFIDGLIVTDNNEAVFSAVTDANNQIMMESIDHFPKDQRQASFELIYTENGDSSSVGRVDIRYNELYVSQRLDDVLIQQVSQSIAYCLVLFALIWLLINKLVLTPLLNLNARLHNITNEISQR